jgi:hypothetical protein
MSSITIDLWPNDLKKPEDIKGITTPASILRQQALLIGEKTSNIIEGEVKISEVSSYVPNYLEEQLGQTLDGDYLSDMPIAYIKYHFFLVVPALANYRYEVLTVEHFPTKIYPVTIKSAKGKVECADEKSFSEGLKSVFADPETRQVIESLMSQSTA